MIEHKIVENLKYGMRRVTTYALLYNSEPLVLPSAFLLHTAVSHPSENTVRTYMSVMKSFYTEITSLSNLTDSNLEEITEQEMSGYLIGVLKKKRELKNTSIEHHISVLKEFFKYLYETGFTNHEINFSYSYEEDGYNQTFLEGIKTDMHDAYFNEKALNDCLLSNISSQSSFIIKRNELVLKLGYYAGFRAAEVVDPNNLSVEQLRKILPQSNDFIPKSIHITVYGKGKKIRRVPIPPGLVKAIYDFIWNEANHLTKGNIICKKNGEKLLDKTFASKLFRKCAKKNYETADNEEFITSVWETRSFHKLRKCFATNAVTHCRENGNDPWIFVPQWLGHSDLATTFSYIYFEALLHKREQVLHQLSLDQTKYGKKFKENKLKHEN